MNEPGRFGELDLESIPTPSLVLDMEKLESNLSCLADLGRRADACILLALKAFTWPEATELVSSYLDGTAASGLWEARLGHEEYGGQVHAYVPGLKANEVDELAQVWVGFYQFE